MALCLHTAFKPCFLNADARFGGQRHVLDSLRFWYLNSSSAFLVVINVVQSAHLQEKALMGDPQRISEVGMMLWSEARI